MTVRVRLRDGRVVTVQTDDPQVAARAAHRFQQENPTPAHEMPTGGLDADTADDAARSGVTGVHQGVAAIPGILGDVQEIGRQIAGVPIYWAMRATGHDDREARQSVQQGIDAARNFARARDMQLPTSQDINEGALSLESPAVQQWTNHEPTTRVGRYARTVGAFAPNALIPGSGAARLARVVVPAVTSEAAGQMTEGSPLEPAARIGGALAGGVVAEGAIGINANAAARRLNSAPQAQNLENEFGQMTAGERSGNARMRLEEDDLRRGQGSDQAQSIMRSFDARRAQRIRDNAMAVVTRGEPALSENVGEAGTILSDELRSARAASRARATQQYNVAFEAAKNEPIPAGLNDLPSQRITQAALDDGFEVPAEARRPIAVLEQKIQGGAATQADVERARQELNRELGAAVNSRNDAAEFRLGRVISALDDWQMGVLRNPSARRAMEEARGIYAETAQLFGRQGRTELSTGHVGRTDLGGRAIDRTINADLTGEQIIDGILGTGTRPSGQALGAVRRIRQLGTGRIVYTNRNAQSGVRVPGRTPVGGGSSDALDMRLRRARQFAADAPDSLAAQRYFGGKPQQPDPMLQSLREGMWHRLLRPLDDYLARVETTGEGGILPAQRMVSQLDNALNRSGREIMSLLYTEREIQAMQRLLRFFKQIVPPAGANYSGTSAGIYRMISAAIRKAASIIPGLGPVLTAAGETVTQANSTAAARRAIAPVRTATATRGSSAVAAMAGDQPTALTPATSAALALPSPDERRRLGAQ